MCLYTKDQKVLTIMNLPGVPALVVFLLLILFNLKVAGDCNVYDTLQSSSTDRCRHVQHCVNEAFFINGNNPYFLDKVFRSTQSRPPVALIITYHVTLFEDNDIITVTNHNGDGSGEESLSVSGSGSDKVELFTDGGSADESNLTTTEAKADNTKPTGQVTYTEQIGWSTTGIYKAIRPVVLVALQPAWYWRTIGRAIENYGFPKSIHLVLNITNATKCNSLPDLTRSEVREALEHLTMNLNYNTTGKTAYIWNTDTNSLQYEENELFITIVILGIFLFVLLTTLLPKLHHAYSQKFNWDSGGLELLLAVMLLIEIFYHILFRVYFNRDLYSNIRSKLEYVVISVALFGGMYGFVAACYFGKCSCRGTIRSADHFCSIYMFVICFAAYSLPVLIEAFIYPTEVISTIGFIMIGFATISGAYTILKRYVRSGSNTKSKPKCWYHLQMGAISLCLYFVVPLAVYMSLVFYLSLLKLLLESPTSQLFQLILTLVPVIVGLSSLIIEKKLGSEKKSDQLKEDAELDSDDHSSDDETNRVRGKRKQKQGYCKLVNEEADQPQDSTNTLEQSQLDRRQLRRRVRQVDNQQHERQQAPQGSSSQEMQVVVEVEPRQNNSLDIATDNESTV